MRLRHGKAQGVDEDQTLDDAIAVFWTNGYEGAPFDDLSKAAGVTRSGIYVAFGNKESLF